jgi:hypothetical protein
MDTRVKPAYDEPGMRMSKRKKPKPPQKPAAPPDDTAALAPDDRVIASNLTLHELFQQQTTAMLERADLDDEQKQSILVAMSCPCCGAGGMSFTAKLKRGR